MLAGSISRSIRSSHSLSHTRGIATILHRPRYQHCNQASRTSDSSARIRTMSNATSTKANGHHANGSTTRDPKERVLTKETINPAVLKAEYAVRGEIAIRAEELREMCSTEEGRKKLGFDNVISCNIGNPQQLEQKPITFFRQVASLTEYPELIENEAIKKIFPSDAIARAKTLLDDIGSIGAYSHSKGVPAIRKNVAAFLEERDGYPADPEMIFLTSGASTGVSNILQVMVSHDNCGIMIPIPQYPLYTAAIALNSAHPVPYYLKEENAWSTDINEMREAVHKARDEEGKDVRALVVINPGNPTGQCLSLDNMKEIIKMAYEEKLVLLADEVYQTNVFDDDVKDDGEEAKPFYSFKKVLKSLGEPYASNLELISFHSLSKGQIGECGRRGGFFELINFNQDAHDQIYKLASIQLCPGLQGQIGIDLMVQPPKKGDESYEQYHKEKMDIHKLLRQRSTEICDAFSKWEGITCNPADGAMYLFPKLTLPHKAIDAAKKAGKAPDAFYCLQLLEKTGICVVPGSGFGQVPGTFHFRTTFLAPQTDEFVARMGKFHADFMKEYA